MHNVLLQPETNIDDNGNDSIINNDNIEYKMNNSDNNEDNNDQSSNNDSDQSSNDSESSVSDVDYKCGYTSVDEMYNGVAIPKDKDYRLNNNGKKKNSNKKQIGKDGPKRLKNKTVKFKLLNCF